MTFAPELVQVVDADPFTEGVHIQGLPPLQLVVENVVDNINGTIRYTAGTTSTGPSTDFNLALITFEALDVATPPDMPTEVAFVVGPTDTGVNRAGQQLLRSATGSWIEIPAGAVDIIMQPESTQEAPIVMPSGGSQDFTVRILPSGEEVTGATISMTFAPELVQVVDADSFTEGVQIQGLPPLQLVVENVVDNINGTIRYTAGTTSTGPSTDFNLALITFEALDVATPPDMPTEVAFVVGPTDTGVSRAGQQLLRSATGSWIEIPASAVDIIMQPESTQEAPIVMPSGGSQDFTVRILPSGEEVTGATISMTFAPELVQVVDADPFTEGVQIQGLPPLQLVVENVVDNINGTIRYTAGTTSTGPSSDFNLALITFEALDVATPPDMPTEVAFVVGPTDTGVSRAGQQLLRSATGSWIKIIAECPCAAMTIFGDLEEGTPITFDGSDSVPGAGEGVTIVQWDWDFGDDSTDQGEVVSHTYADNGSYEVRLTVTDSLGGTGTTTRTLVVSNLAPTVTAAEPQEVDEGEELSIEVATFTDPGTLDTHIAEIDWGDGTAEDVGSVTGTVPGTHTYADDTGGPFTVTVTVIDDDGGAGSATFQVTVNNVAPSVDAGPSLSADSDQPVSLAATFSDAGVLDTHTAVSPSPGLHHRCNGRRQRRRLRPGHNHCACRRSGPARRVECLPCHPGRR